MKDATDQVLDYADRERIAQNKTRAMREMTAAVRALQAKYGAQLAVESVMIYAALILESQPNHWLVRRLRNHLARVILSSYHKMLLTATGLRN